MDGFESHIRQIGRGLHAAAAGRRPRLYRGLTGALLARAMADPALRDALFRLVDVLPQLDDGAAIATHLRAYLAERPGTDWTGRLLALAAQPRLAWTVRLFVRRLARHFLAEETPDGLARSAAARNVGTACEASRRPRGVEGRR